MSEHRPYDAVAYLTAQVAQHTAAGHYKLAAYYATLLVEAQDRVREQRAFEDREFRRTVFAASLVNELRRETHVVVGDHDAEERNP